MSLRTSFVLMILFIVLGSFAFFDPLGTKEKAEKQSLTESRVLPFEGKKLAALKVTSPKSSFRAECTRAGGCPFDGSGEWKITEPAVAEADPSAVGSLAGTFLNLTHTGTVDFEGAPDPKEFGLNAPQATVEFTLVGEAKPVTLQFGKASPTGPNLYASSSASPHRLFFVPNYLLGMVSQDLFHWQSKRLFPGLDSANLTALAWQGRKLAVRAEKTNGVWRLTKPAALPAGQITLEALGSAVVFAAAKGVYSGKAPTGKPELEISMDFSLSGHHTLRLYPKPAAAAKGPPELLAAVDASGPVFVVDATPFARFQKDLLEYRDRTLLKEATRARVDEMRLEFPREKKAVTLRLTNGAWAIAEGDKPATFSAERPAAFLAGLGSAEFTAILPEKGASPEAVAYRTQPADLILTLRGKGEELFRAKFVIFDRRAAVTAQGGEIERLPEDFLRVLPTRLSDLETAANRTVVVPEKGAADGHGH